MRVLFHMVMKPKLDRWVIHGNCLVGYIYDSKFPNGTRVQTNAVRFVDVANSEAECLDGRYKLCDPGTYKEHQVPGFGAKTPAELPKIDTSIFLNPRG